MALIVVMVSNQIQADETAPSSRVVVRDHTMGVLGIANMAVGSAMVIGSVGLGRFSFKALRGGGGFEYLEPVFLLFGFGGLGVSAVGGTGGALLSYSGYRMYAERTIPKNSASTLSNLMANVQCELFQHKKS